MPLPRPVQHATGNYDTRRVQDATRVAFSRLTESVPWLAGVLLDEEGNPPVAGLAFTAATPRDVGHGLGRKPRGAIVVAAISGTPSLPLLDLDNSDARTLRITCAATCRLKLWVW
jgi:hypothetical protein